jgi:hypothetical protein
VGYFLPPLQGWALAQEKGEVKEVEELEETEGKADASPARKPAGSSMTPTAQPLPTDLKYQQTLETRPRNPTFARAGRT